jgi:FkbM family methyltransferase
MMSKLAKRLKRFLNLGKSPSVYPQIIEFTEYSPRPLKFHIHSDTEIFRTKGFGGEREQLGIFLKALQANDVTYDIGASIGLNAILTALACPQGKVVAFEPEPLIRQRFEANIALNAIDNLQVLPYALTKENGQLSLYTGGTDTVSPSLHGANVKQLELETITVTARTIDSLIEEDKIAVPDVLKIDIEGAEYDALLGAEKLFRGDFGKAPRLLFIEVHPEFLPQYGGSVELMEAFLERHAYEKIWELNRNHQIHHLYRSKSS